MRRYAINSVHNLRDLGGYNAANYQTTQYKKIFRSDCPIMFQDSDIEIIESLQIDCVIDFRTPEEILKRPSYFSTLATTHYYNIEFENGKEKPINPSGIPALYLKMMEDQTAINNILKTIAEAKGNVLYHCAVGKDRTGIVSALILRICDVPIDEIVADYQISETYLYPLFTEIKERHPDWPEWSGSSRPEYMRVCFERLELKYGSFEGYLERMGLNEGIVQGVRGKLLG